MGKITYKNKATGKTYTGDAKDVARVKAHPTLGHLYTFEAEADKPAEPKTAKTAADPAESKDHEKK